MAKGIFSLTDPALLKAGYRKTEITFSKLNFSCLMLAVIPANDEFEMAAVVL